MGGIIEKVSDRGKGWTEFTFMMIQTKHMGTDADIWIRVVLQKLLVIVSYSIRSLLN